MGGSGASAVPGRWPGSHRDVFSGHFGLWESGGMASGVCPAAAAADGGAATGCWQRNTGLGETGIPPKWLYMEKMKRNWWIWGRPQLCCFSLGWDKSQKVTSIFRYVRDMSGSMAQTPRMPFPSVRPLRLAPKWVSGKSRCGFCSRWRPIRCRFGVAMGQTSAKPKNCR